MSESANGELSVEIPETPVSRRGSSPTIQQLFEIQVRQTPAAIALVYRNQALTYEALNIKANQVAWALKSKGVGPDCIVGLMVNRSLEMIIGILGVLKAGGAYLPIDPGYPEERIRYMIEDSRLQWLLTQNIFREKAGCNGEVLFLDNTGLATQESSNPACKNHPGDLAYVIYTSGSTGKPKGVMIENGAVVNLVQGITDRIAFRAQQKILAVTTISFDIFVLETTLALLKGLTVVLADEEAQKNPALLSKLIQAQQIDLLQMTPSRLKILMESPKNAACLQNVAVIMVGGETFPETLLHRLQKLTRARIYNMYGPTETTVWSTVADLTDVTAVNIGKPILNTDIYIVDDEGKPLPTGEAGELWIGGAGLARGYLKQPELTSTKFVELSAFPGKRLYRTGDLARRLRDGSLECLGRMDDQVKIKGFRIEPGEIEEHLRCLEGVHEAAVVARDYPDGGKYLCAFLVADHTRISPSQVKAGLALALPKYMIPHSFRYIEAMPLTPNGKINRKRLMDLEDEKNLDPDKTETSGESGLTEIGQKIMAIVTGRIPEENRMSPIKMDVALRDMGVDSVKFIEIVVALEMEFDFEFGDDDLDMKQFSSIADFVSYVKLKTGLS